MVWGSKQEGWGVYVMGKRSHDNTPKRVKVVMKWVIQVVVVLRAVLVGR